MFFRSLQKKNKMFKTKTRNIRIRHPTTRSGPELDVLKPALGNQILHWREIGDDSPTYFKMKTNSTHMGILIVSVQRATLAESHHYPDGLAHHGNDSIVGSKWAQFKTIAVSFVCVNDAQFKLRNLPFVLDISFLSNLEPTRTEEIVQ